MNHLLISCVVGHCSHEDVRSFLLFFFSSSFLVSLFLFLLLSSPVYSRYQTTNLVQLVVEVVICTGIKSCYWQEIPDGNPWMFSQGESRVLARGIRVAARYFPLDLAFRNGTVTRVSIRKQLLYVYSDSHKYWNENVRVCGKHFFFFLDF